MRNIAKDILLGIAVGDALGVPYEFTSRAEMKYNPAIGMVGFMAHNQPKGTWSDDSSLTFCLAESILEGYSLTSVAKKFIKWKNEAYWTARGIVFDIGITTEKSITDLQSIIDGNILRDLELLKYKAKDYDNGNGSLMRIAPLIFELKNKTTLEQFEIIWRNSALTHKHIRSAMSCFIYLKLMEYLILGVNKFKAYELTQNDVILFWKLIKYSESESDYFNRVIQNNIMLYQEDEILSGSYVIESLEASLWCFFNTDTYKAAVLKAVNLGNDTDTTAAIVGGIAGVYYGSDSIPKSWKSSLARFKDIEYLSNRLMKKYI